MLLDPYRESVFLQTLRGWGSLEGRIVASDLKASPYTDYISQGNFASLLTFPLMSVTVVFASLYERSTLGCEVKPVR